MQPWHLFHYTLKPVYDYRGCGGRETAILIAHPVVLASPFPYRARAATAARPIHPATILPAPEVEVAEVLEALAPVEVPVEEPVAEAVESEAVPVAVAEEEDLPVLLAVEEAMRLGEKLVL